MNDRQIDRIVEKVVERLGKDLDSPASTPKASYVSAPSHQGHAGHGVFETVDTAMAAAAQGFENLQSVSLEGRKRMVAMMRKRATAAIEDMSRMAVAETGLGRVTDKLGKNKLAIDKTPGPEILESKAWTGDEGMALLERAPYGIIGSITPCTNASETIINNAISMFSAGNVVVFNVHPSAKGVCNYTVNLLNEAIMEAGGPANTICSIANPTIASANAVMTHPKVKLVAVTGGPAVVKAAMNSGKRAIAAGPGNPPCVVDETADMKTAAEGIIAGHAIDNNIVCIAEKELIVVEDVADMLKRELLSRQVVEIKGRDLQKLEKLLITPDDHVNRNFVGKNPSVILKEIGINVSDDIRVALCEVNDENHPFVQHEMLLSLIHI